MLRFNLGIMISFLIIMLMITSNGFNDAVNDSPEPSGRDLYTGTETLPESKPTEELSVNLNTSIDSDLKVPPGKPFVKNSEITSDLPLNPESLKVLDMNSEADSSTSIRKDLLPIENIIPQSGSEDQDLLTPKYQHTQNIANSFSNQNTGVTSSGVKDSEIYTEPKTTRSKSHYEHDIAGGSWVDTFRIQDYVELTTNVALYNHKSDSCTARLTSSGSSFNTQGVLQSKEIALPNGMYWDSFFINKTEPAGGSIEVSILNANNNQVILGSITTNGEIGIRNNINSNLYPAVKLKATFASNGTVTPQLHNWGISWNASNTWRDSFFGGLKISSKDVFFDEGDSYLPTNITDWYKDSNNPILKVSTTGWDSTSIIFSTIIFNGTGYMMLYCGESGSNGSIGLATSSDGITWTKYSGNPVLTKGSGWEGRSLLQPIVLYDGTTFKMWYTGFGTNTDMQTGYATSNNGINWQKYAGNPVLPVVSSSYDWDNHYTKINSVYYDGLTYKAWYTGLAQFGSGNAPYQIGYATSTNSISWAKHSNNPIISSPPKWYHGKSSMVVLLENDQYYGWHTFSDGIVRHANFTTSNDGINWTDYPYNPIIPNGSSGSWDDNYIICTDIIFKDKQYYMYYRGNDGSKAQIGLAKSKFSSCGSINSTIINLPKYQVFDQLILNKTEPTWTFINISIIDPITNICIPGFRDLRGDIFNLSAINELGYTSIRLIANFSSDQRSTPILYNWAVTWRPLPALTVDADGAYVGIEGFPVPLTATCNTVDHLVKFEFRWDLDHDGNFDTPWCSSSMYNYTWFDDHTGTITVQVCDNYGRCAKDDALIFVMNISPSVSAGLNQVINEGEIAYFIGIFFDPGALDTHTIKWDFDDGNTGSDSLYTSNLYTRPGIYNVTLTVFDDDGGTGKDNCTIIVLNLIPRVFAGDDKVVDEGEIFSFNGTLENPGHDVLSWYWDFDILTDGPDADNIPDNDIDSTELNTTHTYLDNGTYTAKLTVIDDGDSVVVDYINISVNDLCPTAVAGPDHIVYTNKTIIFNASGAYSYPDEIINFTWDFGDGAVLYGFEIKHTYSTLGIFTVTLTVTDDDGSTAMDAALVRVNHLGHWCGYIAYEDLKKQKWCDYDFNDFGMMMYVKSSYRYDGKLTSIEIEHVGMLKEAGYNHKIFLGIGILGCARNNWSARHYDKTDTLFWADSGSGSGVLNLTIFNFTNRNVGYSTVVRIDFMEPINPANIADIPFDPYMYVLNTKEEIHVGYNQIMSIKDAKSSNPFIGLNETPLILIVELDDWVPPNECQRIWKAYPYFDDWIYSQRTKYLDWYKYPA